MHPRVDTPGYYPQSRDTDEWAERIQFAHWRRLEPWEKAHLVGRLCEAAHRVHLLGLSQRFPRASQEELELRAACIRLGARVVEQVLGRRLSFDHEEQQER